MLVCYCLGWKRQLVLEHKYRYSKRKSLRTMDSWKPEPWPVGKLLYQYLERMGHYLNWSHISPTKNSSDSKDWVTLNRKKGLNWERQPVRYWNRDYNPPVSAHVVKGKQLTTSPRSNRKDLTVPTRTWWSAQRQCRTRSHTGATRYDEDEIPAKLTN